MSLERAGGVPPYPPCTKSKDKIRLDKMLCHMIYYRYETKQYKYKENPRQTEFNSRAACV